jgi:hypothetical protein
MLALLEDLKDSRAAVEAAVAEYRSAITMAENQTAFMAELHR